MDNLKPCPFCGADKAELVVQSTTARAAFVECKECKSKSKIIKLSWDEIIERVSDRAIKAWNTRGGET